MLVRVLLAVLVLSAAPAAPAGAGKARLDAFLRDVQSLKADFTQILLDENRREVQRSGGTVAVQRPGRFRWDYRIPYRQLIVADGEKLWFYDSELAQVTVRDQGQALGATPLLVLAGTRPLEEDFTVTELGEQGPLAWVELVPRRPDTEFQRVRVAFGPAGLARMELVDGFGQTSRLIFTGLVRNPTLDPGLFRFTPPPGVDVIEGK